MGQCIGNLHGLNQFGQPSLVRQVQPQILPIIPIQASNNLVQKENQEDADNISNPENVNNSKELVVNNEDEIANDQKNKDKHVADPNQEKKAS